MQAWVVRSGGQNESDVSHLFEANSVAAIGWRGIFGDLSGMTREEIKGRLRDAEPGATDGSVRSMAGCIYRFVNEIAAGDLILTPPTGNRGDILIGYCEGRYEYRPELIGIDGDTYNHTRKVRWLPERIPKSKFKKTNTGGDLTVYSVTKYIDEIEAVLGWSKNAPDESVDPWSPDNIESLAEDLLWESEQLQEIIDDLQEKRQVIFYGPPGTGKTYVARAIAKQCVRDGGVFEIVQFHPSYSYEDFVEGFRPKLIGGQPGFELVPGPLKRIAEKAKNNPKATFILVIDELNRGNVAKVFGELYFLLEYRDEAVRLQYGGDGEGFSLPSNLWFICTMNTADRSIALMDAALRRRFYFAPFFPDEPPVKGLLRQWLEKHGQDTLAADLIDSANAKLERDTGIGPSYFMRDGQTLDETRVRRIWNRAVIPYVEEQCFGDIEKLKGFEFDFLKRERDPRSPSSDEAVAGTDLVQASNENADAE